MTQDRRLFDLVLGEIVRQRRKAQKLSQDDLAKHLGVSQPVVSRLESGSWPIPASALVLLAELLDIGGVGRVYALADAAVEFIERAADAIRPGSLQRVAPNGLAAFVVALLEHRSARGAREQRPHTQSQSSPSSAAGPAPATPPPSSTRR